MEPMQIASFAAAIAKHGIFQTAVTVISAALYFGVLCEALVHGLMQGLSFEAVYNLHPDKQGNPVFRPGYCGYTLDLVCSPTALSVNGGTANIVIIHLYNTEKFVFPNGIAVTHILGAWLSKIEKHISF